MTWLEEQTKDARSAGSSLMSEVRGQPNFRAEALDSRKLSELECRCVLASLLYAVVQVLRGN
jgi:hypothetical protein